MYHDMDLRNWKQHMSQRARKDFGTQERPEILPGKGSSAIYAELE